MGLGFSQLAFCHYLLSVAWGEWVLCVTETVTIQTTLALNGNGISGLKFGHIFSEQKSSSAFLSPGISSNRNSGEQMVGSREKLMLQDQIWAQISQQSPTQIMSQALNIQGWTDPCLWRWSSFGSLTHQREQLQEFVQWSSKEWVGWDSHHHMALLYYTQKLSESSEGKLIFPLLSPYITWTVRKFKGLQRSSLWLCMIKESPACFKSFFKTRYQK